MLVQSDFFAWRSQFQMANPPFLLGKASFRLSKSHVLFAEALISDHFSWLPQFQLPIAAGYILISTGQILFSASWISILAQVPKFNPKEPTFIISDVGGACLSYVCWCTLWPHQTRYDISMYIHHQSKRSASQLNQLSPINLGLNIRNPFPFEGVSCFPHPNCHVLWLCPQFLARSEYPSIILSCWGTMISPCWFAGLISLFPTTKTCKHCLHRLSKRIISIDGQIPTF